MGGLGGNSGAQVDPGAIARAIGSILESSQPKQLMVPAHVMQTLVAMSRQFGLQAGPSGEPLLAGIPLVVSEHILENSGVLAIGVS